MASAAIERFVRDVHRLSLRRVVARPAISPRGRTFSAAPIATASPGMPHTTLVASSWAIGRAAGFAHFLEAARAVLAHAREQQADGVAPHVLRNRAEQHINRRLVPIHRRAIIEPAHIAAHRRE